MMKTKDRWITGDRKSGGKITHFEVWYFDPYRKKFFNEGWLTIARVEKLEREGKQFFKGKLLNNVLQEGVRVSISSAPRTASKAPSAKKASLRKTLR